MDRLGLKEGEVIQHSMISKSIERAQKKVEENNFGIRKRLLEYDDVMNSQREVIYTRRRNALYGERIDVDVANMLYDVSTAIINDTHGNVEFEEFKIELIRNLSIESPFNEKEFLQESPDVLTEKVYRAVLESFERKTAGIARQAYPVIKEVFEKQSAIYENIVVPISDGQKVFQIVTNLKKAYESGAKELSRSFSKTIILYIIDDYWKEHLREMDELKQSVQNAAYEQKDPLLIYKFEAYELFKSMIDKINRDVISILLKAHIPLRDPSQVQEAKERRKLDMSQYETSRTDALQASANTQERNREPVRVEKKVGRNDPCPCGSGKKFKACHGKNIE
jgi:preprotein translocase subunit SecA